MVGFSDHPQKIFKNSTNRRHDSDEIDVFEAAKYFSGAIESDTYPNTTTAPFVQIDMQCPKPGGRRLSLDMPVRKVISSQTGVRENQTKEKYHKQPSSPGGRFAKIFNALFNQNSLKKVKSKTWSTAKTVKDKEENNTPSDWRRKRRSSMSNFQLQSSNFQQKQNYTQSFNPGFRTPPVYPQIPKTLSYKNFRSYSDQNEILPYEFKNRGNDNPSVITIGVIKTENHKHAMIGLAKEGIYSPLEERKFTKFSEADDGADSDSSSDLFDLPNCERNLYTSGLPVYEITHIDRIKRCTG